MSGQSDKELQKNRYRFTPIRYTFMGYGLEQTYFMPQIKGLYAFPKGDDWMMEEESSSSGTED